MIPRRHWLPLMMTGALAMLLAVETSAAEGGENQPTWLGRPVGGIPDDPWIKPFARDAFGRRVWACKLAFCNHRDREPQLQNIMAERRRDEEWWITDLLVDLQEWYETEGKRIEADWLAGHAKESDQADLTIVKTMYWDRVIKEGGEIRKELGLRHYFRFRPFTEPVTEGDRHYQEVVNRGLPVLHKLYNQQELTGRDREAFSEWLIAYYADHYIGGVVPYSLPADNWHDFGTNLLGMNRDEFSGGLDGIVPPGQQVHNMRMLRPELIWDREGFDITEPWDTAWHLRLERHDEILQTYQMLADEFESTGEYPLVSPRDFPSETPDDDRHFYIYNHLEKNRKPVIYGTWLANGDEGNYRITMFMHLYYRAWGDKLDFIMAELGYNDLEEKGHLNFNMQDDARAKHLLLECVRNTPFLPTPCLGAPQNLSRRFGLISPDGVFMGHYERRGEDDQTEGTEWCAPKQFIMKSMVGLDRFLVRGFAAHFDAALAQDSISLGPARSRFGKTPELSNQNGYDNSQYHLLGTLHDIIGEVIAVDSEEHTLTVLREAFDRTSYPNLVLMERFNLPTGFRREQYMAMFDQFEKEGNSREARTFVYKVNQGVYTFVNGQEVPDESGFEPGDVVSVMIGDEQEVPFLIRGLRFNFPPTIDPVQDVHLPPGSEEREINLTGITDNNLVAEQEIEVNASSSSPELLPMPEVRYGEGESTAILVLRPVAGQAGSAEITVTVRDSGGTEAGGSDTATTKLTVSVGPRS